MHSLLLSCSIILHDVAGDPASFFLHHPPRRHRSRTLPQSLFFSSVRLQQISSIQTCARIDHASRRTEKVRQQSPFTPCRIRLHLKEAGALAAVSASDFDRIWPGVLPARGTEKTRSSPDDLLSSRRSWTFSFPQEVRTNRAPCSKLICACRLTFLPIRS